MIENDDRHGRVVTRGSATVKATAQAKFVEQGRGSLSYRITGTFVRRYDGWGGHRHYFEMVGGGELQCGGPNFCKVCIQEQEADAARRKRRIEMFRARRNGE
jgi:hypothetical protein